MNGKKLQVVRKSWFLVYLPELGVSTDTSSHWNHDLKACSLSSTWANGNFGDGTNTKWRMPGLISLISQKLPNTGFMPWVHLFLHVFPRISDWQLLVTRSTAHIGPRYEIVFVTREVNGMLIIPMEKYVNTQDTLKLVFPLVEMSHVFFPF
jgi:hypothetical protein